MPDRSPRPVAGPRPDTERGTRHGDRARVLGLDGSLAAAPAEVLVATAFQAELDAQAALARDLSLTDIAHTVMLVETGVLPTAAGARLLRVLLDLHVDPGAVLPDAALGDLYTNREYAVTRRDPDVAGWLGAGRARREATTTAFHLVVRRGLVGLAAALARFGAATVDLAQAERATVLPDYTYLQAAQPTTLGHYLLGFVAPVRRDHERIRGAFARVDRCPAGIGSGNGSVLTQDRERVASLLGFGALAEHGRDAVWAPDLSIEVAGLVTGAAIGLDRLAEDLLVFASEPFGFVELADAHARASRALPQKRNPFALTHVRAVANQAIGASAAVAAAGRMPTGQPDTRAVPTSEVPALLAAASGAAELLAATVAGLRVDRGRCEAALARSDAAAPDVAAMLVRAGGLDFRTAHRVVARLVGDLHAAARPLGSATTGDLGAASVEVLGRPVDTPADALAAALDPHRAIEARGGPGGASAADLEVQIADARAALGGTIDWCTATLARLEAAEASLLATADRLAGAA